MKDSFDNIFGDDAINALPTDKEMVRLVASKKASRKNRGQIRSVEAKEKMSAWQKGKKLNSDHIQKVKESCQGCQAGIPKPKNAGENSGVAKAVSTPYGNFVTITECAEKLELGWFTVYRRFNSTADKWKDWYYITPKKPTN